MRNPTENGFTVDQKYLDFFKIDTEDYFPRSHAERGNEGKCIRFNTKAALTASGTQYVR
jgi:hypothetical protein